MKRLLILIAVSLMLGGCVVYPGYDYGYYDRGYYPYAYDYYGPSVGIFYSDSYGGYIFRGHHGGFYRGNGGHHRDGGYRGGHGGFHGGHGGGGHHQGGGFFGGHGGGGHRR